MNERVSRRQFLKGSLGAAALAVVAPTLLKPPAKPVAKPPAKLAPPKPVDQEWCSRCKVSYPKLAGDGKRDDTAAVQGRINHSHNGAAYFPTGTFLITAPVVISDRQGMVGGNYLLSQNADSYVRFNGFGGSIQNAMFRSGEGVQLNKACVAVDSGSSVRRNTISSSYFAGNRGASGLVLESG